MESITQSKQTSPQIHIKQVMADGFLFHFQVKLRQKNQNRFLKVKNIQNLSFHLNKHLQKKHIFKHVLIRNSSGQLSILNEQIRKLVWKEVNQELTKMTAESSRTEWFSLNINQVRPKYLQFHF